MNAKHPAAADAPVSRQAQKSRTGSFGFKAALAAAALACLGSAQAAVLKFDEPVEQPLLLDGVVLTSQGFELRPQEFKTAEEQDEPGSFAPTDAFVGTIIKGGDPDICGVYLNCPTGNPGAYYAGVNAGILALSRADGGYFNLSSFDAAFLGAADTSLAATAGLLFVQARDAEGNNTNVAFTLPGGDDLSFKTFQAASGQVMSGSGNLATGQFAYMFFFAAVCDDRGACAAFQSNAAQFALDNVNVNLAAAVPEPSQWALMALGLGAVGALARRRQQRAAA